MTFSQVCRGWRQGPKALTEQLILWAADIFGQAMNLPGIDCTTPPQRLERRGA